MKFIRKSSVKLITLALAAGFIPQLVLARSDSTSRQQGTSSTQDASTSSTAQTRQEVRTSKLIGTELKTAKGEALGQIRDLVVNPQNGQINFAIIGMNAGAGAEALAPIPWQALNLHSEKDFVANLDKSKLQSGPRMSQQEWDKLMQPDYVVQIYRFYGFEPPAAVGGTGQGPGGTSSGSGQSGSQTQGQ